MQPRGDTTLEKRTFRPGEQARLLAEAEAAQRRFAFLAEASTLLAASLDYEATLAQVAHLAVPALADWCVVDIIAESDAIRRLAVAHADAAKVPLAQGLQRYPPRSDSPSLVTGVLRTGEPELIAELDPAALEATAQDAEHLALLRRIGGGSMMVIPLRARGRTLGVLSFVASDSGRRYGPADLALAADLGRCAALAVDNARLYEETRAAERAKQESLALLDTLFATAPVGFGFWDRDLRYVRINDALAAINGLSPEAHLGRTINELLGEFGEVVAQYHRRVLESGEPLVDLEVSGETPAARGRQRYWQVSYYPVRDAAGEALGVGAVVSEISERKRAEAAQRFLTEASTLLAASLDYEATLAQVARLAVPVLADLCIVDMIEGDGSMRRVAVTHADPARESLARELQRYPPDRSRYHPALEALDGAASIIFRETPDALLATVARDDRHLEIERELRYQSAMLIPLVARGRALGVITLISTQPSHHYDQADLALAEDLARRAAMAVDNARLYRESQEAIRARDEFLSVAAHELKTPLTTLRGFAQLTVRQLARGEAPDPAQISRALDAVDQQSEKLARLVAQLLDVSRIQGGQLAIEPVRADLAELVRSAADSARVRTTRHSIVVRAPESLPALIDPLRLEQVVANLVDNAIKYSPDGGQIEIDLGLVPTGAIRLAVRDYGVGIPLEHRSRIFHRFYQAHANDHLGGMGLGLYIARRIVELHGGRLEVDFPSAGGTRFVVHLPVNRDRAAPRAEGAMT